jgi:ubiquinone/menaquinone biosynthesis C-methylase UbiE
MNNPRQKDPTVCSAKLSGILDTKIRKLVQDPKKILKPYIKKDMVVLDIGCGPGFFTIEISKLLNGTGKVIGADLQEEMLLKLKEKVKKLKLNNIELHKTEKNSINLKEKVDFILVFYMLHEVPSQKNFINELRGILKDNGKILISEPKFEVKKVNFEKSIQIIENSGFTIVAHPDISISRSILIQKSDT